MTTTTSPEAIASASRWRSNGHVSYRANDTGTFIAQDADYFHLHLTRNGKAVLTGSLGTLAEAKAACPEPCTQCNARPSGHGHFALYCAPCADLPYGVTA